MKIDQPHNNNTKSDVSRTKRVTVNGIEFDEDFLAGLVANHLRHKPIEAEPTISTAFQIYMYERTGRKGQRFAADATRNYNYFLSQFGDLPLRDIRLIHGAQFRDAQLAKGLNPVSVRKQFATLNAMLNLSFKLLKN